MARRTFESFIPSVTGQLKPMLDAFLEKLGIRKGKEEVSRIQKLEKMGRVTSGFVPETYREIGEQFGMEETGFRASHQASILEQAMQLFGLEEQWYQFQQQMAFQEKQNALDRALSRELAKLSQGGGGGGGISFDFGNLFGGTATGGGLSNQPPVLSTYKPPITSVKALGVKKALSKFTTPAKKVTGIYQPVKPTKAYQPTQKATTYRGVRLGRI